MPFVYIIHTQNKTIRKIVIVIILIHKVIVIVIIVNVIVWEVGNQSKYK